MRPQPITSRPIRSAASVFIIALIIGISFVYLFTKQAIEQKKERALIIAIGHADALQNHLLQTLSVTDALAALVRHENGNIANFEALASEILHQYPGADAIALEPNGVIEHIYPKEGNAQAIRLNLLEAAGRKTEAVQARDSKKLTLAGPFDLVQGGIGILGFRPVFLENASGETTFWGFTNVVMHLPEALGALPFHELDQLGYAYALWRINPTTQTKQDIATSQAIMSDPVSHNLNIANAQWMLSIEPKSGWLEPTSLIIPLLIVGIISLLLAYSAKLLMQLKAHEKRLEQEVQNKTTDIQNVNNELQTSLDCYRRLTQLYEALSLCNKAIINTRDEQELFPIICHDAVIHGGMQMAWIGVLDKEGLLQPAASFGTGTEYLDHIQISIHAELAIGRGPTGTAMRENTPYWCQDFQTNPATALWHSRGAQFGWASSAALPLHNEGKVIGALTLYSQQINAFDKPAQSLLIEMAAAISGALDRFSLTQINKQNEDRIQYLAHFDQLTGLPNRVLLQDRFQYAVHLSTQHNEHIAILLLDLDHFKTINDTLGHSIGDLLLIEISQRLKTIMHEEDTVSRMGGDEFVFILPHRDTNKAAIFASQVIDVISYPYQIEQHELNISASMGIAFYPDNGKDFENLLKNADTALYQVKQSTRNNFKFFASEMNASSAHRLQLINGLKHAIERNELSLNYQPQIDLTTNSMIGVEALLRWHHPTIGSVSPAEFIPIAEESGHIIAIGEWVLRTAVTQAKHWQDQGMPPLIMAVNLSAIQFRHPNLIGLVTQILDETGLAHHYLELELTEAVAINAVQEAITIMDKLDEQGIRMSIDDFGTGYSSLSYLKKFKVYKLKIDQSFVRDINEDPEDKAIVSAIINLSNSLGLKTIAEGVETIEQLHFLRDQGCSEVQGYYFSKPLTATDLEIFAAQHKST